MRNSVLTGFTPFTVKFEGRVGGFMYLDVLGLVTTDIGVLIDPVEAALTLPWMRPDGNPATPGEIREAWQAVKDRQDMKLRGGMAYRNISSLRLTDAGVDLAVRRKLTLFDRQMQARYPDFESYPADCQLGLLSMCWAMGGGFKFPTFDAHIKARSFDLAAEHCSINTTGNPGVKPRNEANRVLFNNAACVVAQGLDPDVLYWPRNLETEVREIPVFPPDEPTTVSKSEGIFDAVSELTEQYRRDRDTGDD